MCGASLEDGSSHSQRVVLSVVLCICRGTVIAATNSVMSLSKSSMTPSYRSLRSASPREVGEGASARSVLLSKGL